jgi:hypothetical protein
MFHEIATDVVADGVGIPDRPGQQMLHAVRAGFPGMLGERPAVLPRQLGQQPGDERPDPPPRLHPSEPAGDPAQQLVDLTCQWAGSTLSPAATAGSFGVDTTPDDQAVAAPCPGLPHPRSRSTAGVLTGR